MSFSTHFQHEQVTQLPLPPLKTDESYNSVSERGLEVARSLLQDHAFMMHLNPFVTGHEAIPASADEAVDVVKLAKDFNVPLSDEGNPQRVNGGEEWKQYDIHDLVPVAFGYKKEVVYHSGMRNLPDGMESLTDAGSGVTLHGKWSVMQNKDDPTLLTLTECATVHCSLLLGWYIKSNMASSHNELHRAFKAGFVEEMKK